MLSDALGQIRVLFIGRTQPTRQARAPAPQTRGPGPRHGGTAVFHRPTHRPPIHARGRQDYDHVHTTTRKRWPRERTRSVARLAAPAKSDHTRSDAFSIGSDESVHTVTFSARVRVHSPRPSPWT